MREMELPTVVGCSSVVVCCGGWWVSQCDCVFGGECKWRHVMGDNTLMDL